MVRAGASIQADFGEGEKKKKGGKKKEKQAVTTRRVSHSRADMIASVVESSGANFRLCKGGCLRAAEKS